MPSSLTRVFPRTLGFSPRLPVSVYGTGTCHLVRSFSRQCGPSGFAFPEGSAPGQLSAFRKGDLPPLRPAAFDALFQPRARTAPCVTPSSIGPMRYRNFRLLSFAYACCLGLGPDLPRADDRCPGNLGFRWDGFSPSFSLLIPAFSLPPSPHVLPVMLRRWRYAPLPIALGNAAASVPCLSPGYLRRRTSRPVSCYALF